MPLKFIKPERILLANHPEYREKWVQERIAEDPSILGLGDIVLRDKERSQPHGGRLDLLFQDSYSATVKLALAIWLVGPLPLLITNALFIKLHSAITASYSLGWLVKLVVAAVAVTLILR